MLVYCFLLLTGITIVSATLQTLFPELKQYSYVLKSNISTGLLSTESESYWTLEGRLVVLVYDNYTRVRFRVEDLETSVFSKNYGYSSYQSEEAANYLKQEWEVDYQENGFIGAIYVGAEPAWCVNVKRALSINFQLKKDSGSYTSSEPCLYASCIMVYTAKGDTIKKYTTLQLSSSTSEHSWSSVPWTQDFGRGVPDAIATAERVYELDSNGLLSLELNGNFQYKVNDHILTVSSGLSLYHDTDSPAESVEKLNLSKKSIQYTASDYTDPTGGIRTVSQVALANRTYEILLKIARKGIDTHNIVRNESLIHSLDFVNLLNTVSQLNYDSLTKLFADLALGTSYDQETARNIFLEVLPHARSDACARFIKYLVVEEREKLEEATILSLIRKLPFNVANHSQSLLEDLEVFNKLGLDFPAEIRHAGILTFATLASKTMELSRVKQDYFDNIVVKYFRMYSDCPQYLDRMVWLQGLCSLGYTAESYIRTIHADVSRNRHERLWASLACGYDLRGYSVLETSLPILIDESEHIQLRIAALHALLGSDIRATDFLFIHNFIRSSTSSQLKRFWYSTIKSLEINKFYGGYRTVSYYVPFVANQVKDADSTYWATNNYILTSGEEVGAASLQFLSVGEASGPMPAMAAVKLSTGGKRPYQAAVYIIAEGVSSNIYKNLQNQNNKGVNVQPLIQLLQKLKVWNLKTSETMFRGKGWKAAIPGFLLHPNTIHIDIVIKIHDKTVYATHINQTSFESWADDDRTKSIIDFLRFGSHINQQLVYYPVQMDVNVPSALGTPIRLQSSIVTFMSVRGNLTASSEQPEDELTWENDLHIRYHGTSLTTLSTAAPLLQSEHEARAQHSLVAHLPIKFNVSCQPSIKSIALTWLNPFAQRAGVAMHSRVQIAMKTPTGEDAYTISGHKNNNGDNEGIFFDCEQKTSGTEVLEKILMSKIINYDILPTPKPSQMLNSILLLTTPSSGSCGIIIPPTPQDQSGNEVIKVSFSLGDARFERIDRWEVNLGFLLSYYSQEDKNVDVYLKVDSSTKLRAANGNMTVDWFLYVKQPYAGNPEKTYWKLCYSKEDVSHAPADLDVVSHPATYEGRVLVTYRSGDSYQSCHTDGQVSRLVVDYKGRPRNVNGELERVVDVKICGEKLHDFDILPKVGFGRDTTLGQIVQHLDKDTINSSALIKEKNGVASISVNGGTDMTFKSDNFAWLLDNLANIQLMKKFGLYRECRLQESTVQTLSGAVGRLPPLQCNESLVLADCSQKPSFAILRLQDGSIKILVAEDSVVIGKADGLTDGPKTINSFTLFPTADGIKIVSTHTDVLVYKRYNETVVLMPHSYTDMACGECVGQYEYNSC
ncbi:uncharacterized protein cv-d [Epargyreus clarus]|uniref:uncharacterized protein cv-d n=1 Tax=Epargyreus clarus TaxID=520877 RepID=UPI003C2D45FC